MINVGTSTLSSACICDLPSKKDLLDGIVQKYNRGSIAHTWNHRETIVVETLLASLKPLGIIYAHLHPMEDPLYWHSTTQASCIHIHKKEMTLEVLSGIENTFGVFFQVQMMLHKLIWKARGRLKMPMKKIKSFICFEMLEEG